MFERIRQMFTTPKAQLPAEAQQFIAKLAESEIWILAVGLRGIPALPDPADPRVFDIVAEHRIDVSEMSDDDSLFPFNFQEEGIQILPFFSSQEKAKDYLPKTGVQAGVEVFQPINLRSGFVATPENDPFELVLDPGSSTEHKLTKQERMLLRALCPG